MSGAPGRAAARSGRPALDGNRAASENIGWAISGYLLGGILVYGGAGWLIGHWVGHQSAFMAAGVIVGVALALTLTILRHGRA